LGDNWSTFDSMRESIPGILNMNIFGIPFVGADICGFLGDTSEELCARWSAMGAFYPFSRNHNDLHSRPQEPYVWPSVTRVMKQVLAARYSLLPYYYTLFYQAHTMGGTVARPLFFEFPQDSKTISIDTVFLIGPALLITPILQPGDSVTAYFPSATWYDYWNHTALGVSGGYVTLYAPMEHLPVHVRGGYILPMQQPGNTALATRANAFNVLVALDSNVQATGSLCWDDGETLDVGTAATRVSYNVMAHSNTLQATVVQATQPHSLASVTSDFHIGRIERRQ